MANLTIFLRGQRVGSLVPGDSPSDYFFSYEDDLASERLDEVVLSASLPVRANAFGPAEARPFFEGLLPEGQLREVIARNLGISDSNSFGLLERLGRDCAGAVVLLPAGDQIPSEGSVEWLDQQGLAELVERLPRTPLGVSSASKIRLSLAGLQRKAVLVRSGDGTFGLPDEAAPSTHILKPQYADSEYEDIAFNEHFCMRVVACVGLETARTELSTIGSHPCLVVERFDRSSDGQRTVRLHQEDFCQALGFLPGRKYQSEGGPGLRLAADLVRGVSVRGGADVLALVRAVIVNFVLGNSDAHAKNYALLYGESGIRLAPLYDVVSTAVYPDVEQSLAMAIGENFDPDDLDGGDLADFAADCGLNLGRLQEEWVRVADKTRQCAEQMAELARVEQWHRPVIDRIVAVAKRRSARLT